MKLFLKDYALFLLEGIKQVFSELKDTCKLVIVTVGNDPASLVYVNNKIKKCESVPNVEVEWIKLDENIHQADLHIILDSLSFNKKIHGILLQFPMPKHLNAKEALTHIAPEKDVDGLTQMNKRFLYTGDDEHSITPCTAFGILMYIGNYFQGDIAGKNVLVIGRSDLVGRPLAHAVEQTDGTLLWANSHTSASTLMQLTHEADIIICAVGKPGFITSSHVNTNKKQLYIDVGINRTELRGIVGDCNLDDIAQQENSLCDVTAVPGGVGQLTTTALLYNLYKCYEWSNK